jgi:RNA polymerase sigma-70 factor (ECF subfamily)
MTDDAHIINTLKQSLGNGFSMLMKAYQEPVYWHIRRLVVSHADAEDATQETFIRIYRSLWQLQEVKSIKAWIFKVATHEALRVISRRRTELVPMEGDGKQTMQALADEYVDYGRTAELRFQQAILSLPRKQQMVFNLRYYDDLSFDAIADIVGSTTVGARMNYHLAKDKIKKYLKTHD